MATAVFILCAATSITCAGLCARGYRSSRSRLLLWSALCFVGLAANNALLVIDEAVLVDSDLSTARAASQFVGIGILLFGLIWESKRQQR